MPDGARPPVRRVALTVAYDGTGFHGWQSQSELPTIQGELVRAIGKALGEDAHADGASRTDAGVHAWGQEAAFTTGTRIPTGRMPLVLNAVLPAAIRVRSAREVESDFQPRFRAAGKLYRYTYFVGRVENPFTARYAAQVRRQPDLEAMGRAAAGLVGTHDFRAFQNTLQGPESTTVRTLFHAGVRQEGPWLHIEVAGDAFLYKMVRNIAGTLLDVGQGRRDAGSIPALIAAGDRTRAGPTAEARGLALVKVAFSRQELEAAASAPQRAGAFILGDDGSGPEDPEAPAAV